MHFYITGDTHRDFDRIEEFCVENGTTVDDVMIILGDAGINYYCGGSDRDVKAYLSRLNITLFCVHGNHEERPWLAADYDELVWNEGIVYVEDSIPIFCLQEMARFIISTEKSNADWRSI